MKILGVNIPQMVVRRIVWVLTGLAVYAVLALFSGDASAHSGMHASRQEAHEHCMEGVNGSGGPSVYECRVEATGTEGPNVYRLCPINQGCSQFAYFWDPGNACPAGTEWDEATKTCKLPNECATRANIGPISYYGSSTICDDGCEYQAEIPDDLGTSNKIIIGTGPGQMTFARSLKSTGVQCGIQAEKGPYAPDKPVCAATGSGHAECVKPDGEHCVTGAKGSVLCWKPGETGERSTADGTHAADRQLPPNQPTPPPNVNNPQPTSPPSSTTINNNTYNTGTWSGDGNTGQSNTGTGGKDKGAGGDGEGDGPGSAGAGVGTLYEGTGTSAGDVFGQFQTRISGAPLVSAATGFFYVPGGSSCPVFSLAASDYWPSMEFSGHCSGAFAAALTAGGYLVLAIFGFLAFRIAFY